MSIQTIHVTLFSAATSLNAFWILNIVKEVFPSVKGIFNFYAVTGPLLGVYLASIAVFCILFFVTRTMRVFRGTKTGILLQWYFMGSAFIFFFAVFSPVYEPIVRSLSGA